MDSTTFSQACKALLGYGWRAKLARRLGLNYSTVQRWANGEVPVPQHTAATLELLGVIPKDQWPARWQ